MPPEIDTHDLVELGAARFEQLVASLVLRLHPDAERPAVPDGGADALVAARDGRKALVWQAKLYAQKINFTQCVKSLDTAVKTYEPAAVTFVFPKDLTKGERETFTRRLVDRHTDVDVTHWGLHRIQEHLAAHPDIARRYFGDEPEEMMRRAIEQGNKPLVNTHDLTERLFDLDSFSETVDPNYSYEISTGSSENAPQIYEDAPFMRIARVRDGRQVTIDARLRPEASGVARFGFQDGEKGDRARHQVRESFAAGQSAELTEGVWLRVEGAPVAAQETYDEIIEAGPFQSAFTLTPDGPRALEMRIERDGVVTSHPFDMRPIPPMPGAQVALGAAPPGLMLTLDFNLPGPPKVRINCNLSYRPGAEAAVNAAAARLVLDFFYADRVLFLASDFLPAEGTAVDPNSRPAVAERDLAQLEVHVRLYEAVVAIETEHGPLNVPEEITDAEIHLATAIAAVIASGKGSGTFDDLTLDLPFDQVDATMASIKAGRPVRSPCQFMLFGQGIDLGLAEFTIPEVVLYVTEAGQQPGSVRLRLKLDRQTVRFRLIKEASAGPVISELLWTPDRDRQN